MKKVLLFIVLILLISTSLTYANEKQPQRENVLEDAVIVLLMPQIFKAIEDYYGSSYNVSTHCERVLEINKLERGSWRFEAKIEVTTFTGAHNSMDTFIITVVRDKGDWGMKEYEVIKAENRTGECRRPS